MSKLGNSFIRGFGATLGSFAARSLVTSASTVSVGYDAELQNVEKKSTISMWKILGLTLLASIIIPQPFGGILFLSCFIILPIANLFISRSKRKKQELLIRSNLNMVIEEARGRGKDKGINIEIPDTNSMSLYRLEELSIEVVRTVNKKIFLKDKYKEDEFFDKIMNGIPCVGMNIENIKDMKGKPSSYEVSENSRTKTEILLYGANKWSGDVFTFKNGILTEFKDR